jgi:hypothetical protein
VRVQKAQLAVHAGRETYTWRPGISQPMKADIGVRIGLQSIGSAGAELPREKMDEEVDGGLPDKWYRPEYMSWHTRFGVFRPDQSNWT